MTKRLIAGAAVAAALAGGLVAPAAATAHPAVSWTACASGFECATVPAPLDYDRPRGPQIALALTRLPATDPAHRIGSLLVNPGGPGGSGVDFVQIAAPYFPASIRARFDIVGFDPRGIYRSSPLLCFDSYQQAVASLPALPFPQTPAQERLQRVADDKLTTACARHGGAILGHMSSADAARDMDLLRRTLGDRKLSYLGYSYGSLLGQNYANMFPDNFRALVIDGVVDPIAWATGRGDQARKTPVGTRIGSADGARATLGEFFRLCDAAGAGCAFSGDASRRYDALARNLTAHPATVQNPETGATFAFTYNHLIAVTLGALYAAAVWPDLANFLAALEAGASPAVLGDLLSRLRTGLGVTGSYYPNDVEGSPGVTCSDTINPRSFGAWQRAADENERRYGYFGRIWNWTWSACRTWPSAAGQDRHLGPWTTRTAAPVLVVGNYFDPATRYQGAQTAARLLPHSRLLSYAGWGHAAYFIAFNTCVNDQVSNYLITGRTPPAGTVCQPQGSPFAPPSALTKAAAATAATAVVLPPAVRDALTGR
ncbi:alpha/beta hydrolase [Actinoplanes sp. CA-030573]|uniref:alpha/beta hydrolase n=1 Tax=Actinoplanes sp. CA-030573 TaxID=3239898 RepID=UPI003D94CF62